jgi:hypothetical protein
LYQTALGAKVIDKKRELQGVGWNLIHDLAEERLVVPPLLLRLLL